MNAYAESNAVLAWLLAEETGHSVRDILQRSELVMASDLTLVEFDRVLSFVRSGSEKSMKVRPRTREPT